MKLTNELVNIQKQVVTQNQIMTVNFLAMTNTEMQGYIQSEYDMNPMIDHKIIREINTENYREYPSRREFSGQEDQSNDYDLKDEETNMPMSEEHLVKLNVLMQLDRGEYSDLEWNVMSRMTDFLDEHGYMKIDLEDVAEFICQPLSLVEKCYEVLSGLNPLGIFSRNVTEYLVKQLNAMDRVDQNLIRLISEYSDDISKGNYSKISREMKIRGDELTGCLKELSKLRINPIELSHSERCEYVIPDIIIAGSCESHEISINDGWMGEYHFNDYYLNLMNTTLDPTLKEYLNSNYQRSRFLFECIEMRRETIIRIMKEIIGLQSAFFFIGESLRPMTLEDIAVRIQMNISTVSRALRGKYIEYPFGSILAKKLFSQGIDSDSGEDQSKAQIDKMILEIIRDEDKRKPLSDGEIEKILKEKGTSISRRTISKYRAQLGILDSYNRKFVK